MIVLDYQDRRPLYEQVTEKFRTLIYQGVLPADSRIPSVRQLAMELSINPNTIQRAYMTLEQEGLIYPVKGKGNFVADTQKIQEKSKENFRQEFLELVRKGNHTGFEEEELIALVQRVYKEEQR
ncbi:MULTISPECIES: GntR family transcriptional regulator [Blautia]|uniref:GntR family transcriptional regulator n=1 Tax=Blautia TaxID=572511 RepID=UPI00156FF3CA|nr:MULTISPECIES: GntR family transcriptional regulator [Blautia]MCB5549234.1 GntR family transcriptional regulator [Blautia sp. MSK17_66]NSK00889.1 GntR family transcriptional regulator [Blautia obeum]